MAKGLFIVFEGPDGAGTTTHAALLAERLKREGREVLLTAEPTDGQYGSKARALLREKSAPASREIQQLFALDREEHIETVMKPALDAGKIVISDRYIPSTLVYGEAQDLALEWLKNLNKNFIQPDRTFLLLPPWDVALERVMKRAVRDAFEKEEFQKRVYEGYVRYGREHPEAWVIDTSGNTMESAEEIWGRLK